MSPTLTPTLTRCWRHHHCHLHHHLCARRHPELQPRCRLASALSPGSPVVLASISAILRPRRRPRHSHPPSPLCRRSQPHAQRESPRTRACTKPTLLPRAAPLAAPRPAPAPGNYQFAYDVDITRDLEPPDDNLLIRVRPAPCPFPFNGTHARHRSLATHDARRKTHAPRRTRPTSPARAARAFGCHPAGERAEGRRPVCWARERLEC